MRASKIRHYKAREGGCGWIVAMRKVELPRPRRASNCHTYIERAVTEVMSGQGFQVPTDSLTNVDKCRPMQVREGLLAMLWPRQFALVDRSRHWFGHNLATVGAEW